MPYKCCVPRCRSNYKDGPKCSVFSFPKEDKLKQRWVKAICRENFVPTKYSKVCELHFQVYDIERTASDFDSKTGKKLTVTLNHPRLVEGAVPSKLPNCPQYLSAEKPLKAREAPSSRRERLENESLNAAIQESVQSFKNYVDAASIRSFEELKTKLNPEKFSKEWTVILKESFVSIVSLSDVPNLNILCNIQINRELQLSVFYKNVEIKHLTNINVALPVVVNSINQIDDIVQECHAKFANVDTVKFTIEECVKGALCYLERLEDQIDENSSKCVAFLKEQISLLPLSKSRVRYSCNTMIFFSLLHSVSPHAYRFLRSSNIIKIPSPTTIHHVCSKFKSNPQLEQNPPSMLNYISLKCNLLKEEDKTVVLQMDEIHLKANCDYKGGTVVGNAYNTEELATSAYVFMIASMLSPFKEVVHIIPLKTIRGDTLHTIVRSIILKLEELGFEVIAVVADNNSVNSKAMSFFIQPPEVKTEYSHPSDDNRQLFYIIDPVHILKCIRNNWINKVKQEMIYPDFDRDEANVTHVASFSALKQLHAHEKLNLLKYGVNLCLKSLYPSSIERQNVKLALRIFTQSTSIALREVGRVRHLDAWEDTANYIEIICRWWDVVNVKTPLKGQRLKNPFQEPITKNSDRIVSFLHKFLHWLQRWEKLKGAAMLTKETHFALKHTTQVLLQISNFWLNVIGNSYLLCGKLQTDNLEDRFGRYRQLAGAQYHISVRQLYECESKLRMQSTLPLVLKPHNLGDVSVPLHLVPEITNFWTEADEDSSLPPALAIRCYVDDDDIEDIPDSMWPLITYVAGYTSHAIMKKLKCEYCEVFLCAVNDEGDKENGSAHNLIRATDRGGLCYPHRDVVTCMTHVYVIVTKLLSKENETLFLQQKNQRSIISLGLKHKPENIFLGHNCSVHNIDDLYKNIVHIASNIFLNNYSKKRNDVVKSQTMPQCKRFKQNKMH